MSENVGVSKAKLVSTAASIRESNNIMTQQLSAIASSVSELNSSWQSDASKALNTIASNMQDKFALLRAEVETFAQWLDVIAGNYESTESGATETVSGISNMFK